MIRKASEPSFIIGFAVSVMVLLLAPRPYNYGIFAVYIVLLGIRGLMSALGLKPRGYGYISDKKTGNPLSFAIVKVIMPSTKTEITHKVADKYGRYYCLVPKGRYSITVERKNKDESYTMVYQSSIIDAPQGIIKEKVVV